MIYLDHAASTPIHPKVLKTMQDVQIDTFGNPSSIHKFGRDSRKLLNQARALIAASLRADEQEIIFTSSGTEADNTAIISTALTFQKKGKHLITTQVEHPAVLRSFEYLEKNFDFSVTYLPVDESGNLDIADFKKALNNDTILVSVMYVNNETGNLMPIKELGEILKNHQAVFHTDAIQAFGLQNVYPDELGIELLSGSAHKLNGPKGVGFLYKNKKLSILPFLHGGGQENGQRAGTENLVGIVGMAQAIEILDQDEKERRLKKYQEFQDLLLARLEKSKVVFRLNGNLRNKLPHIVNLQIVSKSAQLMITKLDLSGFAISAGSACMAGNLNSSHVLKAMHKSKSTELSVSNESIRVSWGFGTTKEDIEAFAEELTEIN